MNPKEPPYHFSVMDKEEGDENEEKEEEKERKEEQQEEISPPTQIQLMDLPLDVIKP